MPTRPTELTRARARILAAHRREQLRRYALARLEARGEQLTAALLPHALRLAEAADRRLAELDAEAAA